MHQSFIAFRKAKYFWVALLLCGISIGLFIWHTPHGPANGGTWLGYSLGTIGALLIIWLTLFGLRKRNYGSNTGTVQGWLSAHVYLGSALLVIATLHCALQFGWNVHTLSYVLMCGVILSGFFGVYTYIRYPNLLARNRGEQTRENLFTDIAEIDQRNERIADKVDAEVKALVESANARTTVGGSWWSQLKAIDHSRIVVPAGIAMAGYSAGVTQNADQKTAISILAERLAQSPGGEETAYLQDLLSNFAGKQSLLRRLRRDIQIHGLLQIWLYVHVPLTFALLAALTAHIVSVFIYW